MFSAIPILFALLLVALPSAAQIVNMSQTADGKFVFTDDPPTDATTDEPGDQTSATRPTQAPKFSHVEVPYKAPRKGAPPPHQGNVVLFAADWCAYCRKARAYLAQHKVRYTEYNIDTVAGREAFARAGGGKGIPLLIAGRQRLRGYSAAAYDSLFKSRK